MIIASQNAKSFPPVERNDPFNDPSGYFFVIRTLLMVDAKSHLAKHAIKKRHKYPPKKTLIYLVKVIKNTLKRESCWIFVNKRYDFKHHEKFVPLKLLIDMTFFLFHYFAGKVCKRTFRGVCFKQFFGLLFIISLK